MRSDAKAEFERKREGGDAEKEMLRREVEMHKNSQATIVSTEGMFTDNIALIETKVKGYCLGIIEKMIVIHNQQIAKFEASIL